MSASVSEINFFDPATNDCPYPAYQQLRDEAPVWLDPRHRHVRRDPLRGHPGDPARHQAVLERRRQRREQHGQGRPGRRPDRRSARPSGSRSCTRRRAGRRRRPSTGATSRSTCRCGAMFDHAFRPSAIKEIDPYVERPRLPADRRVHRRRRVRVGRAVRRPAAAVRDRPPDGRARGGHAADQGVDRRVGAAARADADRRRRPIWSAELEIEAQHYFQPIFERLRESPDDTLLSDLVNTRDPRVGPPAQRQRAPRGDDGRHVRRRLRDDAPTRSRPA